MDLNPSQKEYVRNNIGRKSERHIARDLGCDRAAVSSYIKALRSGGGGQKDAGRPFPPRGFLKISPRMMTVIHVGLVCGIALLLRLFYLKQLGQTLFFAPVSGGYDDYIFDNWAMEILRGNWLGDRLIYIYRMPLYVYFLSSIYFIFGHSYAAVYIIQSVVGAATCLLVYVIGRILFGRGAGLAAGLMAALYGPILFYTGMLVGEVLGMFITCLAFLSLLYFQKTERIFYLSAAGVLIGLSMLLRGNMLIVLPFIILWIFVLFRKGSALKPVKYILIMCFAISISVLPVIIRNYVAEKDFVPITALGGFNIYIGNAHGAEGKYRLVGGVGTNPEDMIRNSTRIAEERSGRKLRPSEVSNFWMRETLRSIRETGFGRFSILIAKKFAMFWNAYELPDIWDYYFFKKFVPILSAPLVGFILIAPLGFVGAYLGWPRRRELSLLYVFIAGYMLSLVAIFITSRYRVQVVPFLAVFAGYGIIAMVETFRRSKAKFTASAAIFICGIVFVSMPVTEKIDFETSYNSLGIVLKKQGRYEEAIKMYN